MSTYGNRDNGVNQPIQDGLSPSQTQQPRPGRYQATAEKERMKWTKAVNKMIMRCYIQSKSRKRGNRKRMLEFWNAEGVFAATEQRLADQARANSVNEWLSDRD